MPRFSLDTFLGMLEAYRITRAELVPPIVLALASHPAVGNYDLSSVRVISSGAAPLGPDLARACADRLGCRVKQGYGMTELGGASPPNGHMTGHRLAALGPGALRPDCGACGAGNPFSPRGTRSLEPDPGLGTSLGSP
jgi:acyl-coenzyme A synthetase/AMP-(fatty) acid ligase